MYVSDVALDDFRSYRHAVLRLEPGVTVLLGANGQGKTNFVEAISYLATLSSHRVGSDTALVRYDPETGTQKAGVVRVRAHSAGHEYLIELEIVAGRANRARLNRDPVRPRQVAGIVQTVVFAPEDLALVRAEPGVRRRFLDELITQLRPAFAATRTEHERVLRQRGALLKQLRASGASTRSLDPVTAASLAVWDEQLAALAAEIIVARAILVQALQPLVGAAYAQVAGEAGRDLVISYQTRSAQLPELSAAGDLGASLAAVAGSETVKQVTAQLLAQMEQRRRDELVRAVNLVGAHRDELDLQLGGLPVKGFASHGESWSVALALKIASYQLLRESGSDPILILDDVFAELDATRRESVVELARSAEQTLITAAVAADVPTNLCARTIRVALAAETGTVLTTPEEADSDD